MATSTFGDLVKAVVDVEREIMAVDADLHADQEAYLLADGSSQDDLWGINLHPEWGDEDWIEFDSVINIRPGKAIPRAMSLMRKSVAGSSVPSASWW